MRGRDRTGRRTTRPLPDRPAAHLHFATSGEAASRLRELGEAGWRIRQVGSPGLDDLAVLAAVAPGPVLARYGLRPDEPYLLLLQHPETRSDRDPGHDVGETLAATRGLGMQRLAIGSNADAGGRAISERLAAEPDLVSRPSVPRDDFAILLSNAAALVGNSSAGLTEAPLLRVPAVNVGERQAGRLQGDNVIDVGPVRTQIADGVRRALDPAFRASLSGRSPHGDGHAAARIVQALADEEMDTRLLRKLEPESDRHGR